MPVQDIKQWLSWLRSEIGFDGWRFDFVKGYPGRHVMEYIEGSSPVVVVGEFWDDCVYTDSKLEYNQVCPCSTPHTRKPKKERHNSLCTWLYAMDPCSGIGYPSFVTEQQGCCSNVQQP